MLPGVIALNALKTQGLRIIEDLDFQGQPSLSAVRPAGTEGALFQDGLVQLFRKPTMPLFC